MNTKSISMIQNAISIRPFIGALDFERSQLFYKDLGFDVLILNPGLSLVRWGGVAFYLQKYYTKDWVDNTMLFFEVENVQQVWDELVSKELTTKYQGVRLTPIRVEEWGQECFLHDPSGILLHFGEFFKQHT